jgi:pimeloyl-ACP methyl ester carboxylesterase
VSAVNPTSPRGQLVDIGGRRLHMVCAGPVAGPHPVIILEAGAFGLSADFGAIQDELALRGLRSCAYDRAGLGQSDPRPGRLTALSGIEDLEALLERCGEPGPYLMVGHSMAGIRLRLFAGRNPDKISGLVLLDAATPEASMNPMMRSFIRRFGDLSRAAGGAASIGLFKPLAPFLADRIGLPAEAALDKRQAFGSGHHNRVAAEEVLLWDAMAQKALELPGYDSAWPVGVITAGPVQGRETFKKLQSAPAEQAAKSRIVHLEKAGHADMLGRKFARSVVDVIEQIHGIASARPSSRSSQKCVISKPDVVRNLAAEAWGYRVTGFFGAGSKPSRCRRLRASLRARRTASAFWRARFSDGFSK